MKCLILISAGLLCLLTVGCETENDRREQDNAQKEFQTAINREQNDLDARLLQSQVKLMRLQYGDAVAATFELCHTSPPTTPAHQKECQRVEALKTKMDEWNKKHPW